MTWQGSPFLLMVPILHVDLILKVVFLAQNWLFEVFLPQLNKQSIFVAADFFLAPAYSPIYPKPLRKVSPLLSEVLNNSGKVSFPF